MDGVATMKMPAVIVVGLIIVWWLFELVNFVWNVYRQIFCDFGETFAVVDSTGEPPLQYLVASISQVRVYIIQNLGMILDRAGNGTLCHIPAFPWPARNHTTLLFWEIPDRCAAEGVTLATRSSQFPKFPIYSWIRGKTPRDSEWIRRRMEKRRRMRNGQEKKKKKKKKKKWYIMCRAERSTLSSHTVFAIYCIASSTEQDTKHTQ